MLYQRELKLIIDLIVVIRVSNYMTYTNLLLYFQLYKIKDCLFICHLYQLLLLSINVHEFSFGLELKKGKGR